ncbi:MAG: [NiFe]-hydrogenase assembly chaperone HybE [Acidihalobacter sp.]|uniref:[NiFe]-hydrogenase assembly chaperone HybE n=1 Tax=Acidihalobacter sp. TaxID=1872108 RepID=UPI00307D4F8F
MSTQADAVWQLPPGETAEGRLDALLAALRGFGDTELAGRSFCNSNVGYAWRGRAEQDGWDSAYVLMPWMLARVYLPLNAPPVELPVDWSAPARAGQPVQLIGPALDVAVGEELHRLHLQWLEGYGHFLLQPLVQNLARYPDAAAVWGAWDGVLAARDRHRQERLAEMHRQQAAVSRRDFLRRVVGAS